MGARSSSFDTSRPHCCLLPGEAPRAEVRSPLHRRQLPVQGPGRGRRARLPPPWVPGLGLLSSGPSALCLPAPQPFGGLGNQQASWEDTPAGGPSPLKESWLPRLRPGPSPPGSPVRRTLPPAQLPKPGPRPLLQSPPPGPAHLPAPKPPVWPSAAGFWPAEEGRQKATSGHLMPALTPAFDLRGGLTFSVWQQLTLFKVRVCGHGREETRTPGERDEEGCPPEART